MIDEAVLDMFREEFMNKSIELRPAVDELPEWVIEKLIQAIRDHVGDCEDWSSEEQRLLFDLLGFPITENICAAVSLAGFDLQGFLEAPLED